MTRYTTLIDPQVAFENANIVKFLDCRASLADPQSGYQAYLQSHLPGAQHLNLDEDLAAPPGEVGRHPLPEHLSLATRLRTLGIDGSDQVVVYDDAGGAFAARAWWCLRWLGHEAVAVLDGGLGAWPGDLTDQIDAPEVGDFAIRDSLTRTIDADLIADNLSALVLIDARSQSRFEGLEEPIDPIAGHIPGALCRPFQDNLDAAGRFRSEADLDARFPSTGVVVCYCGSGVTAAHNILAMRIAGREEPLLYPGSWSEWIRSDERPREP